MTHVPLNALSEADCKREIEQSRIILQEYFGASPNCFAYPYGIVTFDAHKAVREAGFLWGRTADCTGTKLHDRYAIPTDGCLERPTTLQRGKPLLHYYGHTWLMANENRFDELRILVISMLEGGYKFLTNGEFFQEVGKR